MLRGVARSFLVASCLLASFVEDLPAQGRASSGGPLFPGAQYATGKFPRAAAVADLNQDGVPDLAAVNYETHDLSVLLGDGSFAPRLFGAGHLPSAVAIDDLNQDDRPDVVVVNSGSDDVTVLLQQP